MLQSSGLASDKDIIQNEELVRNEDFEMDDTAKAKMRALLFYAEQKAKRVSKIKSKTFRKLRKKKLFREEEEALERLRETDPELAKEEEERQAMLRAKERASLRQKNTSKRMRELGKRNKGAAGEDLQNKMKSIHAQRGGSDESSDDEDDEDLEEMAQRHLDTFEHKIQHETKGLAGMKFMQKALERDHLQAKQDAVQLLKRLRNEDDDDDEIVEGEIQGKRQFGVNKVEHRKKQQLMSAAPAKLFEEVYEDVEPIVVKKPEEPVAVVEEKKEDDNNDNPWLSSTQVTLRNKKSSSAAPATMMMQVDKVMENLPAKPQEQQQQDQREIVKRAFANVAEEDFAKEKKELEEKDEEPTVATAGAGWGSWTGLGVKEKKKPAPLPARFQDKKVQQKANVIVSTRTNKLHRKYQVETVPYPFTSREQYEKSLQDAVGKEWNTVKQHEKKVLPAVQVKAGTIIQPIQLPKGQTSSGAKQVAKQPKKRFASRKAMS